MKKIEIDLSDYTLYRPNKIIKNKNKETKFVDIQLEDHNTFFIKGDNGLILTHNCDGDSICGLLFNFFAKWKELFELGMIYRVITPLLVIKKGKEKKFFYTQEEWTAYQTKNSLNGWEILYKKGLGSLENDEYKEMIQNPRKVKIIWDETSQKLLECWFSDNVELRKEILS